MSDILGTVPLSAIRVFEAAARLGSFTRAAAELGMTQAAVSWQVKALERRLDKTLFRRLPREVALTTPGERLARASTEAMETLRTALADLSDTGEGVLSITTLQTLASEWLAPRIGQFQLAHPQIAVRLEATHNLVDLARDNIDVGIRMGAGPWPGVECVPLFPSLLTPVCSPALAAQLGLQRPQDLLAAPRIGLDHEWALWFGAAGVEAGAEASAGQLRLAADAQALEVAAALADQGVALASPILFGAHLASGRLVQPFETIVPMGGMYLLAYAAARARTRKIVAFRDWILDCVAQDPAVRKYVA